MAKTANFTSVKELTFKVKRGDTFDPPAMLVSKSSGSSYDFTDYKASLQIKQDKSDDVALITLTDENGGIVLSDGGIKLYISADDMDIEPGDYSYDLQITYPSGRVKTWLQGTFIVTQDVTR